MRNLKIFILFSHIIAPAIPFENAIPGPEFVANQVLHNKDDYMIRIPIVGNCSLIVYGDRSGDMSEREANFKEMVESVSAELNIPLDQVCLLDWFRASFRKDYEAFNTLRNRIDDLFLLLKVHRIDVVLPEKLFTIHGIKPEFDNFSQSFLQLFNFYCSSFNNDFPYKSSH